MSNQDREELSRMINGIARRSAYKLFSRNVEDVIQDLWVAVLEKEQKVGHDIDLNLAAKICYDKIKDMIDYDQRRNHYSLTDFETSEGDYGTNDDSTLFDMSSSKDFANDVALNDLSNYFPEDSKEDRYIKWYLQKISFKDYGIEIPSSREADGYTEGNLAAYLGFPSASSSAYRTFRNKMQTFIKDYLKGNA